MSFSWLSLTQSSATRSRTKCQSIFTCSCRRLILCLHEASRNISSDDLIKELRKAYGYDVVRQRGSHIRLTAQRKGEHSITIPAHDPIAVGTLKGILDDVAAHFEISRDEVQKELFD